MHLGAHADGPNHYGKDSPAIHERSLEYYLGPCQVIRIKAERGKRIMPSMVQDTVSQKRVLFASGTYTDPTRFTEDFAALSPELVDWLADQGVITVGIDTPSVDLFSSKDLPAHHAVLRQDMAILEGLALRDIPAGVYELISLPLRLVGFDASPVRAVLRSLSTH